MLPHAAELGALSKGPCTAKITQALIELGSLHVRLGCGHGAWAV